MRIRELYTREVLSATIDETLTQAARRMTANSVSALAVLDEGKLVGIITERDLTRAAADGTDPNRTFVAAQMSLDPVFIRPDDDSADAARLMLELEIRHLPVVQSGQPVGMVSARDLLVLEAWEPSRRASV